jgi:molybdopterin-containing oxidoreductase family membrane subunit
MAEYQQVDQEVYQALRPPSWIYKGAVAFLGLGILGLLGAWVYQIRTGMGVAGISFPVGWGVYIGSFVFWIGIAHSGTLISAILLLVRSRWRTAISRSAEAMTVIAIAVAGMFPLIHLGRFWVVYYILPYPSQRQIWPNFQSPLVCDLLAISTYFTVSVIFFYVGLVPDIAAARDHLQHTGEQKSRQRLYHWLALGWHGRTDQWRHYGRSYLFFAALATPLVVSVHSVVSWDFATSILPGWHSTLFAPYFVAGAIHSGLAMVLTLLIPMRKLLHLENIIRPKHFNEVALLMIVTTLIIGYSYAIELFMAWYSGDPFERQFAAWRLSGPLWGFYPLIVIGNVLLPLLFVFKRVRTSLVLLFIISICVNIGMWSERLWIVITSTAHDFLPHNWGWYVPRWVEIVILNGSICLLFLGFMLLAKYFPAAPISDIKLDIEEEQERRKTEDRGQRTEGRTQPSSVIHPPPSGMQTGVVGVYRQPGEFLDAVVKMRDCAPYGLDTYTPVRLDQLVPLLGRGKSPVRLWTLLGALSGVVGGFALAIGTALVQGLIVGGKHPVSITIYCIAGFEGLILLGALANLIGMLVHARLPHWQTPPGYDWQFSQDRFGLFVAAPADHVEVTRQVLESTNPERIYVVQ